MTTYHSYPESAGGATAVSIRDNTILQGCYFDPLPLGGHIRVEVG